MTHEKPVERRGKTQLYVLLAVFVVLAVAVFWVWRQRGPAQPDFEQGRAASDKFLELIRAGDASAAWESTTTEFKSAKGRGAFVQYVKEHPVLSSPVKFVSVQSVTVQNSPRAEYLYRAAEGEQTVRLLAGNERGTWCVDRLTVD